MLRDEVGELGLILVLDWDFRRGALEGGDSMVTVSCEAVLAQVLLAWKWWLL